MKLLAGEIVDRFSGEGAVYVLLPKPSDAQFGHSPQTLAKPMHARWAEAHPGKVPDVGVLVEVLRVSYRHYQCPTRRNKHPGLNAVQWAMADLNQYITARVSGRPNVTLLRMIAMDPRLGRSMTLADLEKEPEQCQSTTCDAKDAEPSSPTPSSSTTSTNPAPRADTPSAPPAMPGAARSEPPPKATALPPSSLVEQLMKPPKRGKASASSTSRSTARS